MPQSGLQLLRDKEKQLPGRGSWVDSVCVGTLLSCSLYFPELPDFMCTDGDKAQVFLSQHIL